MVAKPSIVGRHPDFAIATLSSVTRTLARADREESFSYAFDRAPKMLSPEAFEESGTVAIIKNASPASLLLGRKFFLQL